MLEENERKKSPAEAGPGKPVDEPRTEYLTHAIQILQAAILGWFAGSFAGLPTPWAMGSPLILAALVWLGDPTRARYPSVMLAGFGLSVVSLLLRPMVDAAAWTREPLMEDMVRYVLISVALIWTGYGLRRPSRAFFKGPGRDAWLRRAALLGLAAAVGLQLTGLWRLGTRLGLGTPEDDILFGAVSAVLLAVGGIAFGRLFARTSEGHVAAALGACSLFSFAALAVVGGVSTPRGFRALCERVGADASLAGTALVDAAVAGSIGVLPLMALGTAVHLARDRGALATILLGLVLGRVLAIEFLAAPFDSIAAATHATGSAALPKLGAIAGGLLLAAMAQFGGKSRTLTIAGLAFAALGALVPVSPIRVLPPWSRFPRAPQDVFETAAGQFTILPGRDGRLQVLLDQRPLLPGPDEQGLDVAAIDASYRSWEADPDRTSDGTKVTAQEGPPARVLVIGLVSPQRATALAELGIERFTRMTTFPAVAPYLEQRLFEAAGLDESAIPAGDHISLHSGRFGGHEAFDLTIIFTPGAHAALQWQPRSEHGSWGFAGYGARRNWVDQDRPLVGVLPYAGGFVTDGLRAFSADAQPWGRLVERFLPRLAAEAAWEGPSVLEWLNVRPGERRREALRRTLHGLPRPNLRSPSPSGANLFLQGFVEFAKIQRVGSPFESADERVVLNERALSLWREFAIAQPELRDRERSMLEGAGDALRAQGEIGWIEEYLAPIAAAHDPWPELQGTIQWAKDQQGPAGRLAIIGLMGRLTRLAPLAEGATAGVITECIAQEVDPGDGAPLILTGLTVRGTDLATGEPREVQVWFPGGVIDVDTGSFTADSPKRFATRVGRGAVVFHRHTDNMGGGQAGHVLAGGADGLLNTFETSDGRTLVLGKGQDRPSGGNISLEELGSRFRALTGTR